MKNSALRDFSEISPENNQDSFISKVMGFVSERSKNDLDRVLGIGPKKIPVMTYKAIVKHFTRIHMNDPNVKQGVVIRRVAHGKRRVHLALICLDEKGNTIIPHNGGSYTIEYLAQSIDNELTEALFDFDNVVHFNFQ